MKKLLLSLLCLVGFVAAQAEEVAFVAQGATYSGSGAVVTLPTGNLPGVTFAADDMTLLFTKVNNSTSNVNSGGHVRWYANDQITITPNSGVTISGVTIYATSSSYVKSVTATTGTVTTSTTDKTMTWSGEATEAFTLTTPAQVRFTHMVVTYSVGEATTAAVPVITPNGGDVAAGTEVSIASSTENATIYYTLDNTDPSAENGNVYSTPIVINESCTLKAIATAEGLGASGIATAEFNVVAPTSFGYVTSVTSGKNYLFVADDANMATPLAETNNYGYLPNASVTPAEGYIEIINPQPFTVTEVEGGYTIQDSYGRYLYQSGTYNSFNVAAEMPTDGAVWDIDILADGQAKITNTSVNKWMQYDTTYKSYGSYDSALGIMPYLYEEGATPQERPTPASLYAVGGFNGWDPTNMSQFDYNNIENTYTLTFEATGDLGFKISTGSGDWGAIDAGVYGVSGAVVSGETLSLVAGNTSNITLPFAGTWTIIVNLDNKTLVATGVKNYPEQLYVLGNVEGIHWNTSNGKPLTHTENGVYEGVVTIEDAGSGSGVGYFSIVTILGDKWDVVNTATRYGAVSENELIVIDAVTPMTNDKGAATNSWSVAAGTYKMVADIENNTFVVSLVPVATPEILPNGGEISKDQAIYIQCATDGAAIYYTIDGTDPSIESYIYEGEFYLAEDCTVKAIAMKDGMADSEIAEVSFTLANENLKTVTFDFTNPASLTPAQESPASGAGITINDIVFTAGDISLVCAKNDASTDCRLWGATAGSEVRTYSKSTITISGENVSIANIIFTGNKASSSNFTADNGTFAAREWTADGNTSSVVFTTTATSNIQTIKVTYEETTSSVDDIEIENEVPATFYNLQGVKVNNPANGIYIKVQGDKASKVYIK